jgi:hypothetical protein
MTDPDRFALDAVDVAVTETADALTYTFTSPNAPRAPAVPAFLVLFFVALPLGVLALIAYALVLTNGDRPEWELVLTGVLGVQLVGWLVLGTNFVAGMARSALRRGTVLAFTAAGVWHGARRVCALADVGGLRLFVYPAGGARPGKTEACLSLVVGEEIPSAKPEGVGGTHGLFGGFDAGALRALAEDLRRRLTAFRFDQGMVAALDALDVVETTENEAAALMHTRPAPPSVSGFVAENAPLVLLNRWAGVGWCLAMLAGLYGSGRLIAAAGLPPAALVGHGFLGLIHFMLLMYHLGGHGPQPKTPGTG